MRRPPEIDIVRKAYELWELSGKPEGRDQEFYLQALQELQVVSIDSAPGQRETDLVDDGLLQQNILNGND
jgi:Protein of unknown function (DUF2934)